jgi:hypothetical protein
MGVLHRMDRRRERRSQIELLLVIWGVDTEGERFVEEAHARDISLSGALLSGITADLRSGDVIGILYGKKKARYRVVWVRYDGNGEKMQVAVHRLESDACPWLDLLVEDASTDPDQPPLNAPSC